MKVQQSSCHTFLLEGASPIRRAFFLGLSLLATRSAEAPYGPGAQRFNREGTSFPVASDALDPLS